ESGGLGIGLTVVKEIVDRHNGWVQVEGRKGEGACFTIHIPLYNEREQKRKNEAKARSEQRATRGGTGRIRSR
ncbi:MAG: ATP-binding protein, partial [Eggerthellaceae bacterium]|nr:ATP-binding protein [Eggerthellaceae bacterium]